MRMAPVCLPGTLLATLGESEHSLEVGFSAEITTVKIFLKKIKEIRKKRRQASLKRRHFGSRLLKRKRKG